MNKVNKDILLLKKLTNKKVILETVTKPVDVVKDYFTTVPDYVFQDMVYPMMKTQSYDFIENFSEWKM